MKRSVSILSDHLWAICAWYENGENESKTCRRFSASQPYVLFFWTSSCPGRYGTLSLELSATLLSHNAPRMFSEERIRATDRWNVTLTLRRFKGSNRVKGKEDGWGRENSYHGDSDITRALCLNGSFVCVEVKPNNSLETIEEGTLWNLSDRNVALKALG